MRTDTAIVRFAAHESEVGKGSALQRNGTHDSDKVHLLTGSVLAAFSEWRQYVDSRQEANFQ